MSRMLRCTNGHQWADTLGLNDGGTVDVASACPKCGAQGVAEDSTQVVSVLAGPPAAISNELSSQAQTDLMTLPTDQHADVPPDRTAHVAPSADIDDGAATLPDSAASHASHDPATLPLTSSEEHDLDRTEGGEDDGEQSASTRLLEGAAADDDKTVDQTQATAPPRPTDVGRNPGAATGKRSPVGPTRATGKFKKDAKLPDKVAGYEILGLLGRGGMGVVYKARQAGLNRLCALKMIIGGGHASQDAVMRFKIEAKAIAHLQHPNIVQVYEIGEENGCPYFSLEYVDGTTLQNKIASTPQPPAETARMMMQICQGVHAAHMRGVLHRDLKPANVLLTKDNVPKITDFGLAKRLEDEDHGQTRTGAIMGTPSYMAPEQAMGKAKELGPPADIYSLGAVMYDMLTGRPPFRGETVMDTLNQVQTLEPMPPEKLVPKVPRDLQTICLKALNKDQKKRYATAADMAEDLRRYLANEPIMARPTPVWERGVKWAKRRPALATLISVSTVAFFTVLTLGGLWLDSARAAAEDKASDQAKLTKAADEKAEQEKKNAAEEKKLRKEAEQAKAEADGSFQLARDAVYDMWTKVGTVNLAYEPRLESVRNQILDKALEYNLKFLEKRGTDPTVRYDAAKAFEEVGRINLMLTKFDESEKNYKIAMQRYQDLAKDAVAEVKYRKGVAVCNKALALVWQFQGQAAQSEKGFLLALEDYEKLSTLEPDDADYLREMANLEAAFADLLMQQARMQEAELHYNTALSFWNTLLAKGVDNALTKQGLAALQVNRGVLLYKIGKKLEAEKSLMAARDRFEDLSRKAPEVPDYAMEWAASCINLGICYRLSNRVDIAAGSFEEAIGILTKLQAKFPITPVYGAKLAHAVTEYGILLGTTDERPKAVVQFGKAIEHLELLHKAQPAVAAVRLQLAQAHTNLGIVLVQSGDFDEGLKHYERAAKLLEATKPNAKTAPDFCFELAEVYDNLAKLQVQGFSKPLEAEKDWDKMFSLREQLVAAYPKSTGFRTKLAEAHFDFVKRYLTAGKPGEAVKHASVGVSQLAEATALLPNDVPLRESLFMADIGLAHAHLANKDHTAAAAAASDAATVFAKDAPKGATHESLIAGIYGQCMSVADADKALSAERRKMLVGEYGDKALAALTSAIAAGYQDVNHLKTALEFRLLRDREAFQALIRDLETKGKTK
ncbi:MAG TPA: protein kinase [Gemmataceae bacterium]|nr:protein kinase [Gemmataceae bacterium]